MSELQAVLFDMDGTVVETESLWNEAEIATMSAFGMGWSPEDQAWSMGGPIERVVEFMSRKSGASESDLLTRIDAEIIGLLRSRPLLILPGIRELHAEAAAAGIPTALVSNSWRALMDIVLEESGLEFDTSICGNEVTEPKPAPDPYLSVCERLGVDPWASVVLEDSPIGIASATAAGCYVVAIPEQATIEPTSRLSVISSAADIGLSDLRGYLAK